MIAVGGTTLPPDQNGNPDRSEEVGWSLGGDALAPLVPTYLASGGGISQYEAQPAYQQGIVTQSTIYRTGPDVAYDANPGTGIPVYDSLSLPQGTPWEEYGGTSIATPQWAALIAIADGARAAKGENSLDGATQLLPALYQISQTDPHAFDDITQGYNGYSAGPGYDLVTGLGTPNAQYLIPDLVKIDSSPAAPATVYWTGDAGDNNWDDPGNWSTVDPARRNVPESVLPGPNDNVVIDLAGATVNHVDHPLRHDPQPHGNGPRRDAEPRFRHPRPVRRRHPGQIPGRKPGRRRQPDGGRAQKRPRDFGHDHHRPPLFDRHGGRGHSERHAASARGLDAGPGRELDQQRHHHRRGRLDPRPGRLLERGRKRPGRRAGRLGQPGHHHCHGGDRRLGGWLTDTSGNLGSLALGTETVELIGTLDNSHGTLALVPGETSSTGRWTLNGGRIDGGTITTTGGAALAAAAYGATYVPPTPDLDFRPSGTLDGVTLNGTLDMSASGAYVAVVDGLTLNTDLYVSGAGAELQFNDGSTVAAGPLVKSATIHLSGDGAELYDATSSNLGLNNYPSQTVTVGRHVIISGESAYSTVTGPIDNQGTIEQNTAGQLTVDELVNDGSVQAGQGGNVTLDSYFSNNGILGQPWSNNADGTITATQGSTLNLYDQWTNQGHITVDATSTVSLGNYSYYVAYGVVSGPSYIWKNSGTLAVSPGATINLGDYFTTDEFESGFQTLGVHLQLSQYTVNLIGTIDNSPADNPTTAGTLTLGASTGPLYVSGGEIDAGTITGTAPLVATSAGGTLDDVVVNGAVNVPASTSLTLQGTWSTTARGTITATGATLNLYDTWTNNGTITVDAASTVSLGNESSLVSGAGDIWNNTGTLAIAPGATINLGDYFTTDEFESGFQNLGVNLNLSQYTVYLIGTMDNSAADNPMTGGTLALDASTGPLYLGNYPQYYFEGVIEQGTITTSGTDDLVANVGNLDGVTLDGTLDMSGQNPYVEVTGGLTLDTDLYVSGQYALLEFNDGSTVSVGPLVKSATIHLSGDNTGFFNGSGQTVTLGRGISISGENPASEIYGPIDNLGTIDQNSAGQFTVRNGLVNDGSIQASNGGGVTIESEELYGNPPATDVAWNNNADGTITATNGATLNLYDNWTNQGTITVDSSSTVSLGSPVTDYEYASAARYIWTSSDTLSIAPGATVNLGDYFTTDEFESHFQPLGADLDLDDYTVNLTGTIDNSAADNPITGGTLAVNHSTGPLFLSGGIIDQGMIATRGSGDLVATNYTYDYSSGFPIGGGTLSDVTLEGTLDMSGSNAVVTVINGLTLDTNLNISGAGASLQFNDSTGSTLAVGPLVPSATVHLSGAGTGLSNNGIQTVTLGQGITISGENPNSSISGLIDNLGAVAQNGAGQLTVNELVNSGSVTVAGGGMVTTEGPFGNAGTVMIATGATFSTGAADYIQWAGTTTVDGLLIAANVDLMGGILTGAGTIQADVTNAALIVPGDPFGTLTIQGNYTQTAAGVLLIQIARPDQYGQLAISGGATLAGTLEVSLLGNYVPAVGASFQILTFAGYTGGFNTEVGLCLPHHRSLKPIWDSDDLTLVVQQKPGRS